jgi:hypothetical protein
MITAKLIPALLQLYPQVAKVVDTTAYDEDGNEVPYDINAVNVKFTQNETEKTVAEQAQVTAKASALSKLMALGLTEEEALALGVK